MPKAVLAETTTDGLYLAYLTDIRHRAKPLGVEIYTSELAALVLLALKRKAVCLELAKLYLEEETP